MPLALALVAMSKPIRIGKVVSLSTSEIPGPVDQIFGTLPTQGRLLSAGERQVLAAGLELHTLDPALPIWVYRVAQLDWFRFSERLDLAPGGDLDTAS